jgi:hypothetical protein
MYIQKTHMFSHRTIQPLQTFKNLKTTTNLHKF